MTDLRLITETMSKLDDLVGRIHRACEIPAGKDGRTLLVRVRDDACSPIKAVSYDPPMSTWQPPSDEQLERQSRDPEALTPPIRSDPTGELAIRRKSDPLAKILKKINTAHAILTDVENLLVAAAPHEPTAQELAAAKEVERVNRPPDNCQNCARAGIDVPHVGTLTNLAAGIEDMRICDFCKAHILLDECPDCGVNPGLPTRAECERHYNPPKRMAAV